MRKEVPFFASATASQGCIVTAASIRGRGLGSALLVLASRHAALVLRLFYCVLRWYMLGGWLDKSENNTACHGR